MAAANNKQTIYASASAQGTGSATQNLNLSVADSAIYSDIKALSVSNSSVGTTTNVNMNVARSYWEGNAYADAYGDKASSNLNINLSDGSVWKGNVGKGLDGSARVTLKNSIWDGDVNNAKTAVFLTDGICVEWCMFPLTRQWTAHQYQWANGASRTKAGVSLQNGSVWNVTGASTVDALAIKDSTVNIVEGYSQYWHVCFSKRHSDC